MSTTLLAPPDTSDLDERPVATAGDAPDDADELSNAQCVRCIKLGALFGTAAIYAAVAGVCLLAAPGQGMLLFAVLWPALFAGWYFGGMVALAAAELRQQRAHPERRVVTDARTRLSARGRPVAAT
jgi:hypothetical protein